MEGYNENIGKAVADFDRLIKRARLPFDAERKILSILRSIEYQVEMGDLPPITVIKYLQTAIRSWIEFFGPEQKKLIASLNKFIDIVLKEIWNAEPRKAGR